MLRGVTIVVVRHEAGWRYHVSVPGDVVRIGEDGDVVMRGVALELDARHVTGPVKVDVFTLTFERYADGDEAQLIAAADDDPSRAVYADWLEQRGDTARAELLRAHADILRRSPDSPEFEALSRRMRELRAIVPYGWARHVERHVAQVGDVARFAVRIGLAGGHINPDLRVVQLWAGGLHLTHQDDHAYLPSFSSELARQLRILQTLQALPYPEVDPVANHVRLYEDEGHEPYWWLRCGETTDGFSSLVFADGDNAIATYALDGGVFAVRMPRSELAEVLRTTVGILRLAR